MSFFNNSSYSYGSAIPFQRVVEPSTLGQFLNLEQAELVRVRRYDEHWRFYLGRHWSFTRDDGEPLVTVNYAKLVIDKAVGWLVENGIVIDCPEATRHVVKPLLTEVWKYNKLEQFLYEMAQTGAVSGDVFVLVTYQEPTALARRRNPNTGGQIRITLLGSEQVFPCWDPLDKNILTSVRIETLYYDDRNTMTGVDNDDRASGAGRTLLVRRFTQTITPEWIIEQFEGGEPVTRPNVLGEIPLIHWPNMPVAREYYGLSDLDGGVIDQQREVNEKATDISDTVTYAASPVTVITGAKAGALERSPRKIWSGLPADARVTVLRSEADLGAAGQYLDVTKAQLLEVSETPDILLRPVPASNSTGAGLSMLYAPIVSKTKRKLPYYVDGMQQINYMILRIATTLGMLRLPFDLCSTCGGRIVEVLDDKGIVPRMVKRCYRINTQDFTFLTPAQVPVTHVRQHSFGTEQREDPLYLVEEEHGKVNPSAYDPEPQEDREVKEAREKAEQEENTPPPVPGEKPQPALPPPPSGPSAAPAKVTLPPEPEEVLLSVVMTHPTTGVTVSVRRQFVKLIPTECCSPQYLDPYANTVEFLDALPRDDQYDATLHQQFQQMQIVSKKWIQRQTRRIKPDEYDNIEEELAKETPVPPAAPPENPDKQALPGVPGRPTTQPGGVS